jgi:hypothetical protein
MVEAKGRNGHMSFDGDFVTIRRAHFFGRMVDEEGKRVPIATITEVQFKPAGGFLNNGFISLTLAGVVGTGATFGNRPVDPSKDPNAVLFSAKQQPQFQELRTEIETAIAAHHARPV